MDNIEKMRREEVLFTLARHAHPSWYHDLLNWSTETLKDLLRFYGKGGKHDRQTGPKMVK